MAICKMEEVGFDVNSFKIKECWGIYYNKGEGVVKHNHFPHALSFVYCVNIPKKSSPIVIEGKKIKQTAGTIIFFLSHQYHWLDQLNPMENVLLQEIFHMKFNESTNVAMPIRNLISIIVGSWRRCLGILRGPGET